MLVRGLVASVRGVNEVGDKGNRVFAFSLLCESVDNPLLLGCQVWLRKDAAVPMVAFGDIVQADVVGFAPNSYQPGGVVFTVRGVEAIAKTGIQQMFGATPPTPVNGSLPAPVVEPGGDGAGEPEPVGEGGGGRRKHSLS
jgi:hypothetical protein